MTEIETFLTECIEIAKDKQVEYRDFRVNMRNAATFKVYLTGKESDMTDIVNSLISLKLSRLDGKGKYKKDTYVDLINYIVMLSLLNEAQ